jgi:hypothetical protein
MLPRVRVLPESDHSIRKRGSHTVKGYHGRRQKSLQFWLRVGNRLARGSVAFDFLGWGNSDKPPGYPYTTDNQVSPRFISGLFYGPCRTARAMEPMQEQECTARWVTGYRTATCGAKQLHSDQLRTVCLAALLLFAACADGAPRCSVIIVVHGKTH